MCIRDRHSSHSRAVTESAFARTAFCPAFCAISYTIPVATHPEHYVLVIIIFVAIHCENSYSEVKASTICKAGTVHAAPNSLFTTTEPLAAVHQIDY